MLEAVIDVRSCHYTVTKRGLNSSRLITVKNSKGIKPMLDATVLIVDDEYAIREMIAGALELAHFSTMQADDGLVAYQMIIDQRPDIILLDWMLPSLNGIALAKRLKKESSTQDIPIILLTAKSEEENKILGLDAGADDYITKPFSTRELISRIQAVLRRTRPTLSGKKLSFEGVELDPVSHRAYAHNQPIDLGPTEYKLLEFFMLHPERAYSRVQLLDQVWGGNVYV